MIRTFLTTQAGATFHETSPRFTTVVRKETVEVIYRIDRGRYLVIHLFHSDFNRVVMLVYWGNYFQRFSEPTVQLLRLRQTCPTLAIVLEGIHRVGSSASVSTASLTDSALRARWSSSSPYGSALRLPT